MGQSTYRLAHQTFAEHLRSLYSTEQEPDILIADGLENAIATQGGWDTANPYAVRYLPQHLANEHDRLESLCTNIHYLQRALEVLGVDALADLLDEAWERSRRDSLHILSGAIRQCRVALRRVSTQLHAQLYARLLNVSRDPATVYGRGQALAQLVSEIADSGPSFWLRAQSTNLGWRNDLDAMQTVPAKARAVAFGRYSDNPLVAIGNGTNVSLWDPRSANFQTLPTLRHRVTAVALSTIDAKPVAVAVGGYDGALSISDLEERTWRDSAARPDATISSLCLATLNGSYVIAAACPGTGARVWDYETGELVLDRDIPAQAIADTRWGLIAANVHHNRCWVHDLISDTPLDSLQEGISLADLPFAIDEYSPVALGQVSGHPFAAVASQAGQAAVWDLSTGDLVTDEISFGTPIRSLAIGDVEGRLLLAAANETDAEHGYIITREAQLHPTQQRDTQPVHGRILGVGRLGQRILALVDRTGLVDLTTGITVDAAPTPQALGELLTGSSTGELDLTPPDATPLTRTGYGYRVEQHTDWPETARAYGTIDGRTVIVRGSYDCMTILSDAITEEILTAAPHRLPHTIRLGVKPATPTVTAVNIGTTTAGPLVALACDGRVTLRNAKTLDPIPIPWVTALSVTAVALGQLGGTSILATGGEGGGLSLWDLHRQTHCPAPRSRVDR